MGKVLKEIKESATQILGVQHSRQREELKQSPRDRTRVGMFKEQQERQCGHCLEKRLNLLSVVSTMESFSRDSSSAEQNICRCPKMSHPHFY